MAITFAEIPNARSMKQDKNFLRTYSRTWRAITDDNAIGPKAVREAMGLSIGDVYTTPTEIDLAAFIQSIEVTEENADDGLSWLCKVEYGPYDPNTSGGENPLDRPIQVSWDWAQFETPVDVDLDGNAVVNSAGDPFDPPLIRDDSRPVLRVVRNEPSFNPAIAGLYKDHVNSDAFLGYGPRKWKCQNITGELQYNPEIGHYYSVSYEFALNPAELGWTRLVLDQGLRRKHLSDDTKRVPIQFDGEPASSPVPLDGDGNILPRNGTPVYLEFNIYPEVAFGGLGFTFAGAPGQA